MKDSYSLEPLKLMNLVDEEKEKIIHRFYPMFEEEKDGGKSSLESQKKEALDVEEAIRKTFEEAYKQGEKAGYEMGMKKVEPVLKRLNNYIAEIEAFKKKMVKRAERLATELSFIIAEAIILKECSLDKNIVVSMIRKALDICDEKAEITIRVRSDDFPYISNLLPSIKIIPDETLRDPGFLIESSFGEIEGTIKTQLEEIKKEILSITG